MWNFDRAAALFPLEYRLREGDAVYKAIQEGIPPQIALGQLYDMLASDPHSPNLWFFIGIQKARLSDLAGMKEARERLEVLAPMWANTATLKQTEQALTPSEQVRDD